MSSDGHNIMAAILAEPHDDLHRLAYADWCEEQGATARAELIRLQLELAEGYVATSADIDACLKTKSDPTLLYQLHKRTWEENLKHRILQLLEAHGNDFWVGLRFVEGNLRHSSGITFGLNRGFPSTAACKFDVWDVNGATMVSRYPITDLSITDKRPGMVRLSTDKPYCWCHDVVAVTQTTSASWRTS